MGTSNEPLAHVHHRIAERVSRDTGVDVTADEVSVVITADGLDSLKPEINDDVFNAIVNEAREYGIL